MAGLLRIFIYQLIDLWRFRLRATQYIILRTLTWVLTGESVPARKAVPTGKFPSVIRPLF